MEKIKLTSNFIEILKKACKVSKEENLSSVTIYNVVYQISLLYIPVTENTPTDSLAKFFEAMSTEDKNRFQEVSLREFEENKQKFDLPDDYKSDPDSGILVDDGLDDILKGMIKDKVEISISSFMYRVFNVYQEYLVDIDCNLKTLQADLDFENFSNKFLDELTGKDSKKQEDEEVPEDLNSFLRSLGFKKGEENNADDKKGEKSTNNYKKDDEDFDKAGESEAINTSSIDPNSKTPFLDQFSYDMTRAARNNKYDPVVGRDREIDQIIKILSCRKKNNAILLGDPGCGKTAIVESLAQRINKGTVPIELSNKRICSLDLNAIVSGTKYRGEYEERLQGIIKEVCNNRDIIIYIDEFHNLIGNGSTPGSGDGANILKPYLARGEFQCIGSTTQEEFRKFVKDGALKRRFQSVQISEPGIDETIEILKGIAPKYEEFHKVKYPVATIRACVELSGRYINDKFFPDKAIDILDTAGAQTKLQKKHDTSDMDEARKRISEIKALKKQSVENQDFELAAKYRDEQLEEQDKLDALIKSEKKSMNTRSKWPDVTIDEVSGVISSITGIPMDQVNINDFSKLKTMKSELSSRVIGQKQAVETFVTVLQRNYLGLRDETKCIASILLTGPSGTGKTLICEEVAKQLFGSKDSFIKYNMGEMSSEYEVSKLIGSPAGYVGYEDEPLLLQVKRHPSSLVLFDEIEKAHPKIFDIFLNIMDKGEIVLSNGERVDFKNTIVVFTGNIGTKDIERAGKGIGFNKVGEGEKKNKLNEAIVNKAIVKTFRPEFINRLTNMITFNELSKSDLNKIFVLEFNKLKTRLKSKGLSIKVTNQMRDYIVESCNPLYGARDLQRNIQKYIETEICSALLEEDDPNILSSVTGMIIDFKDNKTVISFNKKDEAKEIVTK